MRTTATACLAIVLMSALNASAQQSPAPQGAPSKQEPQTQLESFLSSKGMLLVKDFYELGKVAGIGSITIDAVVITQPGQADRKIRGLRIEVAESGRLERSDTSFLDMDEIESLSKALAYMIELSGQWKGTEKQEYTEVQFATKGDFAIGFYQKKKDQGAFVSSGRIGSVRAFIQVADFGKVKALVDQAAALLQGK